MVISSSSNIASFYRHSGKMPPIAGLASLLAAAGAGVIGGAIYGALGFYAHLVPSSKLTLLLEVFLVLGFGMFSGIMPTFVLKRFNARSTSAAMGAAVVTCLVGYYAAWILWSFTLLRYVNNHDDSFIQLVRPDILFEYIQSFNEQGVWYLTNDKPTGIWLTIIWVVEAMSILSIATVIARRRMLADVFCEHCMTWGTKRDLMQVGNDIIGTLRSTPDSGKVDCLTNSSPRKSTDGSWCNVSIEGCSTCDNLQALNVRQTIVTTDKKGKKTTRNTDIIKRLLLTPEQTVTLAMIAASHAAVNVEGTVQVETIPGSMPVSDAASIPELVSDATPPPPPGPA